MEVKNTGNRSWLINNGVQGCELSSLPRCCGISKTTGNTCKRAAKKGLNFCGIHAGDYTPGQKKGAQARLKHGIYTTEAKEERKEVLGVARALYGTIGSIQDKMDCLTAKIDEV